MEVYVYSISCLDIGLCSYYAFPMYITMRHCKFRHDLVDVLKFLLELKSISRKKYQVTITFDIYETFLQLYNMLKYFPSLQLYFTYWAISALVNLLDRIHRDLNILLKYCSIYNFLDSMHNVLYLKSNIISKTLAWIIYETNLKHMSMLYVHMSWGVITLSILLKSLVW